jgi:hypothetical protein
MPNSVTTRLLSIMKLPDRSRPPFSWSNVICASGRNSRTISARSPRLIVWPPVL